MNGTLYGVGIGPGDADMITLKAYNHLQASKVIAYPAPDVGDSLARRIAAPHMPDDCREIIIRIPLDPKLIHDRSAYDTAALDIAAILRTGENVTVICEGDPFFYGSFMYLFNRLSDEFNVEIIPGISSLMACASASQTPLVAKNEVLSVLPAPLEEEKLRHHLERTDAAAIIKLGRHTPKIYRLLNDMGLLNQATYVEHATMDNQKVKPLRDIDPTDAPYFAMILIRKTGVGR